MHGDIKDVPKFHVYSYQHLDDLSFLRAPEEVDATNVDQWRAAVGKLLAEAGWEGDGDLKIMWFPPFVGVGIEDTSGTYVWVVKQSNNGTAWIASPVPLNFPSLLDQNR